MYTDGSYTADCLNIGAGVFSDLCSFYAPAARIGWTFDREVEMIPLALSQIKCLRDKFTHVVILTDSKSQI
jgi:hypothetical protein